MDNGIDLKLAFQVMFDSLIENGFTPQDIFVGIIFACFIIFVLYDCLKFFCKSFFQLVRKYLFKR